MKMNWRSSAHIFWLLLSIISVVIAFPFCMLPRRAEDKRKIILTGHKFNGNLLAFYHFIQHKNTYNCAFLTMDRRYYRELRSRHVPVLFFGNPLHMIRVARAGVAISDHGPGLLKALAPWGHLKLVDVWHGIPFKGYTADSLSQLHAVDEVWLTSEHLAHLYGERFGFKSSQVRCTGYARTDMLVNNSADRTAILQELGIEDRYAAIVTFAPTWKQDDVDRDIFPFNISGEEFFFGLDQIGKKHNVLFVFRAHLNDNTDGRRDFGNIVVRSYSDYVVTEETLAITDILVTDWSSIAFDFLVTRRPMLFLDVPPPFREGFTFDGSYRVGPVVGSYDELLARLVGYIQNPDAYGLEFAAQIERAMKGAYGDTADGHACERYLAAVDELTR
jgi:CDP-glycerol glycerophosphotransferase